MLSKVQKFKSCKDSFFQFHSSFLFLIFDVFLPSVYGCLSMVNLSVPQVIYLLKCHSSNISYCCLDDSLRKALGGSTAVLVIGGGVARHVLHVLNQAVSLHLTPRGFFFLFYTLQIENTCQHLCSSERNIHFVVHLAVGRYDHDYNCSSLHQ